MEPLVSVVIPTCRRPRLVKRAVQSALNQSLGQIEVIVVIDGPDPTTREALATINDPRLRVLELPHNQGSCGARNAGVAAAAAKWIAFLDDDDEWMLQKLELQLEAVKHSVYSLPIATCYLVVRSAQGECIWPRRVPSESEPLSEYLFVRHSLFQGEGLIQTSTILTAKELLHKVPFLVDTKGHQDWDWLLRATTLEEVGVEFVHQPLSIWDFGETGQSLSRTIDWQCSFHWIQSKRDLVTPRAYSSFILAEVSSRAALAREWKAFFPLLWEALRQGAPKPNDLCLYFGMWLIPPQLRSWLRTLLIKERRALST